MFKIKLNNLGLYNQEKQTNGTLLQSNDDIGTMGDIKERFVSIKIKRQSYDGKAAIVLILNDVTKKINSKL